MADYEVIPREAIDYLKANPTTRTQFDTVFGAGRSAEVLGAPKIAPQEVPSITEDDDWSVLGESYRAIAGGVRDAAQETGNFTAWVADSTTDYVFGPNNDLFWTENGFEVLDRDEGAARDDVFLGWIDDRHLLGDEGVVDLPEVAENKTTVGRLSRGITQFVAGYYAAGSLTRMTGLMGAFTNGAIADAVVFNPNDPNVAAILEDYDIDTGALGEILATDPEDPEYINRLRNVAEGALAGGLVEALGWSVRALRASRNGDLKASEAAQSKAEEALAVLDDAIKENAEEVARDTRETLEFTKRFFDVPDATPTPAARAEVDGQLNLDLGDAPAQPRTVANAETQPIRDRIYLTPEKVEKIRLQTSLAKDVPTLDKLSSFSFRSLDTVSSYKEVEDELAGTAAVLAEEFSRIKGGDVQRWATVKAQAAAKLRRMAEMTREDPETLIKRFQSAHDGNITKMAAEIHAQERYVLTLETELKSMARTIADANDGKSFALDAYKGIDSLDELKIAFMQRKEVATNVLAGLDSTRSNVARAMNAMKIAKQGDKKLREALRDPDMFRDVDAAARAVVDQPNSPAVRTIDETLESLHGFLDKVNTFRINALLSGPGTQEVNFISNVINSFAIPFEQLIGSGMNREMAEHALRQFQGAFLGYREAIKGAYQAGWEKAAILDPQNTKFDEAADLESVTGVKRLDDVITLPSRLLMSMDEYFKQAQYRGRIFADASMEAKRLNLTGEAREEHIKNYIRESFTEDGAATRGDARLQAQRATFTQPLEPGLGAMLQNMAIKAPLIRFIIPFVRTPINLLSETIQHTPMVGFLSKRLKADLEAGGVRAAQARGKQIIGTGLVLSAAWLAASGNITGSGPKDPRIRKVWLKNNQPYAFRILEEDGTVTWISYARLEPLSNVFSITADMMEISEDQYNEAEKIPIMQALAAAVMENTVNKTFTQGISDAMDAFNGEPHAQKRAIQNMIASFVPNVLNQTNGDVALRETRTLTDAIMARTGLYNQVDPKRNILGEPIIRQLPKYDPLGLSDDDNREIDPVLEEITRMAIMNQSVADNPQRRLPGPDRLDLSQIPYSNTQSLYDRWLELTGEVKIGGKDLRQKLSELIESDAYKSAPAGDIGITSKTKGAMIRKVVSAYRKKAQSELPELMEVIRANNMGIGSLLKEQANENRTRLFESTPTSTQVRSPRALFADL